MLRSVITATAMGFAVASAHPAVGQSLIGSPRSMAIQNREAHAHDFTYLRSPRQIRQFVKEGLLVPIPGNANYELHDVSYPYARPEVRVFLQRLSREYRAACGEKLEVTSLVRPMSMHLWNSSSESVHPTGMAMDLHRSNRWTCRHWIEHTLLQLEGQGVLEATAEHHPPHYHVALFPHPYKQYVAMISRDSTVAASTPTTLASDTHADDDAAADADSPAGTISHEVVPGESLWSLARHFGTTVAAIQAANNLDASTIYAGQLLHIPSKSVELAQGASDESVSASAPPAAPANAATADPASYRVGAGDTLWGIARDHGVTVNALKRVNKLHSSRIQPGQVLTIPASGA